MYTLYTKPSKGPCALQAITRAGITVLAAHLSRELVVLSGDRVQAKVNESLLIREICIADAETAAELTGELGYPVSASEMARRIDALRNLKDHVVYVACMPDGVVGWIEVSIAHHLSAESRGEIGGFVVASSYRNRGVGRTLIARAEQWVAHQGMTRMVVRSQIAREAAHRFYVREGYSRTKTSAVFSKELT